MTISSGILLYKFIEKDLYVFLVHPGGPFWQKKDKGVWSIPKGETQVGESIEETAKREFEEETGFKISGTLTELSPQNASSSKIVHVYAHMGDLDPKSVRSNTFKMEWPPKSGQNKEFLENDRSDWFDINIALNKIVKYQVSFLLELAENLDVKVNTESISQPNLL